MPIRTNEPVRHISMDRADRVERNSSIKYHSMHPGGQRSRSTTKAKQQQTTSRTFGVRALQEIKKYQAKRVDRILNLRDRHLHSMMDIKEDYANFPEGIKFRPHAFDARFRADAFDAIHALMEAHMVKLLEGDAPAVAGREMKPVMLRDIPVRRARNRHRDAKKFIANASGGELWNDDLEIAFAELDLDADTSGGELWNDDLEIAFAELDLDEDKEHEDAADGDLFFGEEAEESDRDDGYDEDQIQEVADRLESKLLSTDVDLLGRFRISTDMSAMSTRDKIELLSEQLTHVTDDEEDD